MLYAAPPDIVLAAMGRRLLHLLAFSLGLPPTWYEDKVVKPIELLRLLQNSGRVCKPDAGCALCVTILCSTCCCADVSQANL